MYGHTHTNFWMLLWSEDQVLAYQSTNILFMLGKVFLQFRKAKTTRRLRSNQFVGLQIEEPPETYIGKTHAGVLIENHQSFRN